MRTMLRLMSMIVAGVFFFIAGSSQASFTGFIYEGDSTAGANPALGHTAIVPLTSTFTVDALNFDSRITGGTTYDVFLSGGPGNPNNLQGLVSSLVGKPIVSAYDPNSSGSASPSIFGTFFQFTGTAFFPANVAITHDDGFYLDLGAGGIYDFSDPVSPTTTNIGNAAGLYTFTLNYGAWNGFPEVLQVPNVAPVPIPGTLVLFGSGMLGLVGIGRRRFKK